MLVPFPPCGDASGHFARSAFRRAPSPIAIGTISHAAADPTAITIVSALALIVNTAAFAYIMYQACKRHINPYTTDVFVNQKYYKDAVARMA